MGGRKLVHFICAYIYLNITKSVKCFDMDKYETHIFLMVRVF